jgi:phage terminase small subunit
MQDLQYTTLTPSECGNYWVAPDGKRHRPLTPKHKKFCRLYVQGMSAAAAARKSGFTTNMISSKVQGSAMIRKNPLVVNHIIELLTKDKERSDVSMETHLTELSHLRDQAVDTGQVAAAISAEVSRGRAAGLYIDRKEVTVSKVENMTTEELFTRLQEIMNKSNMKVIEHEERKEHIPVLEAKPVKGSLAKS